MPGTSLPQNLLDNPITKITWGSQGDRENIVIGDLQAFTMTQAGGQRTRAGRYDDTKQLLDNFSFWKGAVYLCGMRIHGEKGVRVSGIGPHWCYTGAYTA